MSADKFYTQLTRAVRALTRRGKPDRVARLNALAGRLRAASSEGERDLVRAELAKLPRGGKPRKPLPNVRFAGLRLGAQPQLKLTLDGHLYTYAADDGAKAVYAKGLLQNRSPRKRLAALNEYVKKHFTLVGGSKRGGKKRGGGLTPGVYDVIADVHLPDRSRLAAQDQIQLHITSVVPGAEVTYQVIKRPSSDWLGRRVEYVPFPALKRGIAELTALERAVVAGALRRARRGGKRRFAPEQLKKGTAAELEHAATIKKIAARKLPVRKAAELIAKDHLKDQPHYYDRAEAVAVPKRARGLKSPRLKLLHRRGKLRVYLVDSHAVRKLYGDWTMGGHARVYDFIPANEVWIAEEVFDPERKLCTLHELNEYKLMGGGQDYDTAHDASTALEQSFRKHGLKGLDAALKKALRAAARS